MEDKKDALNENDAEKVSGGSMKRTLVRTSSNVNGTEKGLGPTTVEREEEIMIPYCDICGTALSGKPRTVFTYRGKIHHMCDACVKSGCMTLFKN